MKYAIFVLGFVVLFLSGCNQNQADKGNLELNISSQNPQEGEVVEVFASATGYGEGKIVLKVGNEESEFACTAPCSFSKKFTARAGAYNVKAIFILKGGQRIAEQSGRVSVARSSKSCVDGVAFGECSGERLYCDDGKLVENCGVCGCAEGEYCNSGRCEPKAIALKFVSVEFPQKAQALKKFKVTAILSWVGAVSGAARYSLEGSIGGKSYVKEFSAQGKDGNVEVELEDVSAPQGTIDLNLAVYSLEARRELVGEYFEKGAIESLSQLSPPAAPHLSEPFVEGDDVVLEWAGSEGVYVYRLYKSVGANSAFISYKHYTDFDGGLSSGVVQTLSRGTHFFVLTAQDQFGNESAYSNVVSASVG